ncbi:MAG: hypothetical protein SWO11_13035 [Thermodesulfobacteriota bacterium]|nr:hypothetical protein [Thermodesulfobacteriota bacterium]
MKYPACMWLLLTSVLLYGCAIHRTTHFETFTDSQMQMKLITSQLNVTGRYNELMRQQEDKDVLDRARLSEIRDKYQILFVMGFLADPIVMTGCEYFNDQMRWLQDEQISYLRADKENSGFNSQNLPSENADFLKQKIEELYRNNSKRKLLIISHSKGGLDTLATLLKYPDILNEKVAGWIPLQTPFEGTPLADWFTSDEKGGDKDKLIGKVVETLFKGNRDVVRTMRTDVRTQAIADYADSIRLIAKKIPILAFASWDKNNLNPGQWTLLLMTRSLIKRLTDIDNDGVLPVDGSVIRVNGDPISHFVRIRGVDHALPVMHALPILNIDIPGFRKFDRVDFAKVLLRLWLEIRDVRYEPKKKTGLYAKGMMTGTN